MSAGRGVGVVFVLLMLAACGNSDSSPSVGGAEGQAVDNSTAGSPAASANVDDESATTAPTTPITTTTDTQDADPMADTPTSPTQAPVTPAPETPPANAATAPDVAAEPGPGCIRLTEFALDAENFGWFIVNDNVMGGRSSGGPTFENSAMIFAGEINTDGGGFSSVRAEIAPTTLAGYTHLIVRARTDQRTYKVTLEDALETRDRRVSQQQTLVFGDADDDGWQTARIDFDDLDPRIFGRAVDSDPFRPDLATQLGIMISDGVDGPFRIEIDWIDVCR